MRGFSFRKLIKENILRLYGTTIAFTPSEIFKELASFMKLEKEKLDELEIEIYNILGEESFRAVDIPSRVLFIPHCLRRVEKCRGEYTERGLICRKCTEECKVRKLVEFCEETGCRYYIVPGGSMVTKLIKEDGIKAAVGIACYEELKQALGIVTKFGVPAQGVLLKKSGCINTDVDEEYVKNIMRMK
ncbi:MAG: uncharacterized protein PWR13_567 [Archaeoglobi archaeon]|nr:uncharacterized protein [Archaeoglobi archaeon]